MGTDGVEIRVVSGIGAGLMATTAVRGSKTCNGSTSDGIAVGAYITGSETIGSGTGGGGGGTPPTAPSGVRIIQP